MVQGLTMDVGVPAALPSGARWFLLPGRALSRLPCWKDSPVPIVFKLIQEALWVIEIEEL